MTGYIPIDCDDLNAHHLLLQLNEQTQQHSNPHRFGYNEQVAPAVAQASIRSQRPLMDEMTAILGIS